MILRTAVYIKWWRKCTPWLFMISCFQLTSTSTKTIMLLLWHNAQSILPMLEIKFRCYEAKIEESEKADSCQESNPGHLSGCQVCDWGIQYHQCSIYRGLWGLVVVWLVWLSDTGGSSQRCPGFDSQRLLAFLHSFVPLYILSYLVPNIQHTIRAYHML